MNSILSKLGKPKDPAAPTETQEQIVVPEAVLRQRPVPVSVPTILDKIASLRAKQSELQQELSRLTTDPDTCRAWLARCTTALEDAQRSAEQASAEGAPAAVVVLRDARSAAVEAQDAVGAAEARKAGAPAVEAELGRINQSIAMEERRAREARYYQAITAYEAALRGCEALKLADEVRRTAREAHVTLTKVPGLLGGGGLLPDTKLLFIEGYPMDLMNFRPR